jgi:hypothetical protein
MNRYIYTSFILLFGLSSFGQEMTLQKGDTIQAGIKLHFNQEAINNDDYLIFKINNDFDFKNLILQVDGEQITQTTFTIKATQQNGNTPKNIPINILSKNKASSGTYQFSLELKESSNGLKKNITYIEAHKISLKNINVPKPDWINYLIYGSIALIIVMLLYIFYKKSITFSKGNIHVSEPISQNYKLKGKTSFDSIKEGCAVDTGISFVIKKAKGNKLKISKKSKNTVLYINEKMEFTSKLISKNHVVKLVKEGKELIFKYI